MPPSKQTRSNLTSFIDATKKDGNRAESFSADNGTRSQQNEEAKTVVSIQEYRKLLSDKTSTDNQILLRLRYLESLCRNVVRDELENYVHYEN